MPPGSGDFERAFGTFLPFDVAHVATVGGVVDLAGITGGERRASGQVLDDIHQTVGADHLAGTDPGGFGTRGSRADQGAVFLGGGHRGGESADHRDQGTVE